MRIEIRIGGFGGQGVGLAGQIIGRALAIYDDREAVMTQAYGPEARGGASSANLVIADEPIDYPFVQQPDILVALSQEAYARFRPTVRAGALIVIDSGLVTPSEGDRPLGIPATQLAEGVGNRIVSNIVMLGFLTALHELFCPESMQEAIRTSVRAQYVDLNLAAFGAGFDFARKRYPALLERSAGALGEELEYV